MTEQLTLEKVKQFIELEVDEFTLEEIRRKHQIAPSSANFYMAIKRLLEARHIKKLGRGRYRKVKIVQSIKVMGRERRPIVALKAPKDFETGEPMSFWSDITTREGDFWLISGFKNKGKTALCMNILAENLDMYPALMGNEYIIVTGEGSEPSSRFLLRLDNMDWVQWVNGNGEERFELFPVYEDYAEQVKPGRLNIIDWVNTPGDYWMISPIMEGIKRGLGRGIGVGVIQKNVGKDAGRGGAPSKDFADVELLLDPFGDDPDMVMLKVETVKESTGPVMGKRFVYKIRNGVKIVDFREVVKCGACWGKGWGKVGPCLVCNKTGYADKKLV